MHLMLASDKSDLDLLLSYRRQGRLCAFLRFLGGRLPKGNGVTILTTSGGAGVLMSDRCERLLYTTPSARDQGEPRMSSSA